jgi:hypothetical protein
MGQPSDRAGKRSKPPRGNLTPYVTRSLLPVWKPYRVALASRRFLGRQSSGRVLASLRLGPTNAAVDSRATPGLTRLAPRGDWLKASRLPLGRDLGLGRRIARPQGVPHQRTAASRTQRTRKAPGHTLTRTGAGETGSPSRCIARGAGPVTVTVSPAQAWTFGFSRCRPE